MSRTATVEFDQFIILLIVYHVQEAGSEHNERLLSSELEFSENDEFSEDEGPQERRVPVPADLLNSDLSSIGTEFDLSSMDKQIELQASLVSPADSTEFQVHPVTGTPPLPTSLHATKNPTGSEIEPSFNPAGQFQPAQEAPILSPEQLQQLALLRYINPYAAAGLPFGYPGLGSGIGGFGGLNGADRGVQVIQTSRPVVKTTDIIKTEVVPIWDGAKTIYSTITRNRGTTVVTETEYGTTTLNPFQQFTVVSSPVVTEITTTSTELRVYRIIFRAQTTFTTVTSTSVFPTVVTTYVSSTVPIQPTAFPGLYSGNFGYPAFG